MISYKNTFLKYSLMIHFNGTMFHFHNKVFSCFVLTKSRYLLHKEIYNNVYKLLYSFRKMKIISNILKLKKIDLNVLKRSYYNTSICHAPKMLIYHNNFNVNFLFDINYNLISFLWY